MLAKPKTVFYDFLDLSFHDMIFSWPELSAILGHTQRKYKNKSIRSRSTGHPNTDNDGSVESVVGGGFRGPVAASDRIYDTKEYAHNTATEKQLP